MAEAVTYMLLSGFTLELSEKELMYDGRKTVFTLSDDHISALASQVVNALTTIMEQDANIMRIADAEILAQRIAVQPLFRDAVKACHKLQSAANPLSQGDLPNRYEAGVISYPVLTLQTNFVDYEAFHSALKTAARCVEQELFGPQPSAANAFNRP